MSILPRLWWTRPRRDNEKETTKKKGPTDEIVPVSADAQIYCQAGAQTRAAKIAPPNAGSAARSSVVPGQAKGRSTSTGRGDLAPNRALSESEPQRLLLEQFVHQPPVWLGYCARAPLPPHSAAFKYPARLPRFVVAVRAAGKRDFGVDGLAYGARAPDRSR